MVTADQAELRTEEEPGAEAQPGLQPTAESRRDRHSTPRPRSTIRFPYYGLPESITLCDIIHRQAGDRCTLEQLRAFLGNTAVDSGAFRSRIAAAALFGLAEPGDRWVALTPRARAIFSMHPEDAQQARVDAFLSVPLFRALYERYRGRSLPPKGGLLNVIEELGVVRNQRETAYTVFDRSAEAAGFYSSGREYLVAPVIRADATRREPEADPAPPPIEWTRSPDGVRSSPPPPPPPTGIHPAILGLLQLLPPQGSKWSSGRKDEWLLAFKATINVIYPDAEPE